MTNSTFFSIRDMYNHHIINKITKKIYIHKSIDNTINIRGKKEERRRKKKANSTQTYTYKNMCN